MNINKYGFGINNNYFDFDLINSFSINENSTVSEFPLVTKQMIVDHKFNEPRVIQLQGTISKSLTKKHPIFKEAEIIENRNRENSVISEGISYETKPSDEYLTSVYSFLRDIKNKNIIIDIITPNTIIKSCVITDIQWNDFNTYAEFNLGFKEIKTLLFKEIEVQVLKPDPNLPDLNDAIPQSAIDTLLLQDTAETDLVIYKALLDHKDMTVDFWKQFTALVAAGVAVGVIAYGIAALAIAFATNPLGWIVGAVVAIAACIGIVVWALVNWVKRLIRARTYIRKFQYFRDEKRRDEEKERYLKLSERIYHEIKQLNNVIFAYSINTDVNQDILVSIDDNLYVIEFRRDKQNGPWRWRLKDQEDKEVSGWKDLKPYKSVYKCKLDNSHFETGNGKMYFVYDIKSIDRDDPCDYVSINLQLPKTTIVTTSFNIEKLGETVGKLAVEGMKIKNQ